MSATGKAGPCIVVIAGPNGAGKSTLAPALMREYFRIENFINADTIAQGLCALAPEKAALAAGRIMLTRMAELAAERRDFAFETTLASRSFAPMLREQQKRGYRVTLLFLCLPEVKIALERVEYRMKAGGHGVAAEVIVRRHHRGLRNFFNLYQPLADAWILLDNSQAVAPRLIARGEKARRVIADPDLYSFLETRHGL